MPKFHDFPKTFNEFTKFQDFSRPGKKELNIVCKVESEINYELPNVVPNAQLVDKKKMSAKRQQLEHHKAQKKNANKSE